MTLTKEDLQAIKALFDEGIKPVEERLNAVEGQIGTIGTHLDTVEGQIGTIGTHLDAIEETIAEIKEDTEITRTATNALVQWADTVASVTQIKFPVEQAK